MPGTIVGTKRLPIPTLDRLDDIIAILGSTKTTLFPFLESVGGSTVNEGIRSYKENAHVLVSRDEAAVRTIEAEFSPYKHVGGVYSYEFNAAGNQYLDGTDDANLGFPSNADFSCGAFIYTRDITSVTIMGKYDVANQREWRMQLDGSSKIELEVLDETEVSNGTRIGASDTAVTADQWSSVVITTNNNDADASMTFFLNAAADGTGNSLTGTYNDSPDTTSAFVIGATLNTAPAVTNLFSGRMALVFVCGKVLTADEVSSFHSIGQELLGLV